MIEHNQMYMTLGYFKTNKIHLHIISYIIGHLLYFIDWLYVPRNWESKSNHPIHVLLLILTPLEKT